MTVHCILGPIAPNPSKLLSRRLPHTVLISWSLHDIFELDLTMVGINSSFEIALPLISIATWIAYARYPVTKLLAIVLASK